MYKKIILGILSIISIMFSIVVVLFIIEFVNPKTTIDKNDIKDLLVFFNEEYSIDLPEEFNDLFTYRETWIDGYTRLMVLEVDEEYKLSYEVKCESEVHENFDIIEHFNLVNKSCDELSEYAKSLSSNYDWYAYEKRVVEDSYRVFNLFVIMDYDTNYLYVYYICTQYENLF